MSGTADFTSKPKIPDLTTLDLDRNLNMVTNDQQTTRRSEGETSHRSLSEIRRRYTQMKSSLDSKEEIRSILEQRPLKLPSPTGIQKPLQFKRN